MRAFGRDHSHRKDELRLSRLQGPRRTRLRDQRAEELAPGLVRARRSASRWLSVGAALLCRLCASELNFGELRYGEVRYSPEPNGPGTPASKQEERTAQLKGKRMNEDRPNAVTLITL